MEFPEEPIDLEEDVDLEDEEEAQTKERVFSLNDRLSALADGACGPVEDAELSQGMAQAVKPYADRLVALKRLLRPIDGIVEKRGQIADLRAGIDEAVSQIESLHPTLGEAVAPALLDQVQAGIALIKKDRKLSAVPPEAEEGPIPGDGPLRELPIAERLQRVFGTRFVGVERLGQLVGGRFSPEETTQFDQALDQVWDLLFETPHLKPHLEGNRLKTLQRAFRDYALIPRPPLLPGPGEPLPCTLDLLRHRFGELFLKIPPRALWYAHLDFYRAPPAKGHWALVDRQYLNCTFKRPAIRLLMYARANELPAALMRQKSALEDVYDRVVLTLALGAPFFDNCNSLTRTTYQLPGEQAWKQVYIY